MLAASVAAFESTKVVLDENLAQKFPTAAVLVVVCSLRDWSTGADNPKVANKRRIATKTNNFFIISLSLTYYIEFNKAQVILIHKIPLYFC